MTTISRFDGGSFKNEPSSTFPHLDVSSLASYRGSPFVTGGVSSEYGLKTEILDYKSGQWNQEEDYPFSDGDR